MTSVVSSSPQTLVAVKVRHPRTRGRSHRPDKDPPHWKRGPGWAIELVTVMVDPLLAYPPDSIAAHARAAPGSAGFWLNGSMPTSSMAYGFSFSCRQGLVEGDRGPVGNCLCCCG